MSTAAKKSLKNDKKKLKANAKKEYVNMSVDNSTTTAQLSIVISCKSVLSNVNRAAIGVVSYAMQKGYATTAENPDYPFFAQIYLSSIFINAMRSINPGVQKVPLWLHSIIHLLGPKKPILGQGSVAFNWDVSFDATSSQWVTDLGPFGANRTWNSGVVDTSSMLNNLFPSIVSPSSGYTELEGQIAWTSVLNYLKSYTKYSAELVNVAAASPYDDDISAFGDATRILGAGGDSNGAYMKNIRSEVAIKTPMLSCWTDIVPSNTADVNRMPNFTRPASGDAIMATGLLCGELPNSIVKSKCPAIICPVDFNRFVDVLGQWVGKLQTRFSEDVQEQIIVADNPQAAKCPLTFQEMQLILRNEFMCAFDKTQYLVQGVYPLNIAEASNPFVPFICGQGTYGIRVGGMQLPQLFVENIRSLTFRYRKGNNPDSYFPAIGVYVNDDLQWNSYAYTGVDSGPWNSFQDPASAFEYKNKAMLKRTKSKDCIVQEEYIVNAETPVSIVDGNSGGSYWAINHASALEILTSRWNEWLIKMKPFTGNLTTVAADGGITVATMIMNTDLVSNLDGLLINGLKSETFKRGEMCKRLERKMRFGSQVYRERFRMATLFRTQPSAHVWGVLQSLWIPPEERLNVASNVDGTLTLAKLGSFTKQPYSLIYSDGPDNVTLAEVNDKYATAMIRARNGAPLMVDEVIASLEKTGRSGILSSLLGGVAKSLIPGIGPVVDTISQFLPI